MISLRRHYRVLYGALILGIAVTFVGVFFIQNLAFFSRSELSAYDSYFTSRGPRPLPNQIAVVGVDDQSVTDLGHGKWPIPRRYVASAVNFLHHAGAKAIGIDFLYPTDSTFGPADDRALARAIKGAGNVVLGDTLQSAAASNYVASESALSPLVDAFARGAAAIGLANVPVDDDGSIRASDLMQAGPGGTTNRPKLYPSFPVAVASVALHKSPASVVRGLPTHMLINFVGDQSPGDSSVQSFHVYQFDGVARGEDSAAPFRNKIVLIIPAAIIAKDELVTPFGPMYGGYVQANALNTILNRDPITPTGSTTNSLILLLVGLMTTVFATRFGIFRSVVAVVALALGYAAFVVLLFTHFSVWVHLVTPEATIMLVFAAIMALRFATEERQRRRTSKLFSSYVKPEIVDLLMNAPDEEKALAGARRPITVLFADVRGFTAMSERMEPEEVVATLDVYLEELTSSVQTFNGTLDKYVGDELMAIWNAPSYQPDHALLAMKSAVDMVSRMDSINSQLQAKGLPAIRYGIGINSGEAVVGQMGSSFRKQYDVIGDTVNTGARLCSAAGGAEIIVGEATMDLIGDRLVVEETEPLRLKGKNRPFRTFRVLDLLPDAPPSPQLAPAPA